jgi:hypothetical protein
MASEDDDTRDTLGPARALLLTATCLGSRAADAGDHTGCFALLACAARLARKVKGLSEVADFRLERALDDAENASEPTAQAEEMQSAIDGLLGEEETVSGPAVIADPLAAMQTYIGMAISIGAPAYNTGDHQGCYDVYAATARMLLATIPKGPEEARVKLRAALDACLKLEDANEQAWAMRHAFDAIGEMGDGPTLSPRDVQLYLSIAIRLGAPAYNAGDHRGCYETYACAARLLVNAGGTPEPMKTALRAALEQASVLQNVTKQAWVMREAFDSLLPKGDEPGE